MPNDPEDRTKNRIAVWVTEERIYKRGREEKKKKKKGEKIR